MMTAPWRERVTYLAMSLVVAWHSLAMIVSPMPTGSGMVLWLRSVLEPYVTLFRLDNRWGFFAPSVGTQRQFRYAIDDAAGERHVFVPDDEVIWSIPHYVMWREFRYLYEGLLEDPESGGTVTALLCRKHASLNPLSVSFLLVRQLNYWPQDYLRGHHPLDPDFTTLNTLTNTAC